MATILNQTGKPLSITLNAINKLKSQIQSLLNGTTA